MRGSFFDEGLVEVVELLAGAGKQLIIAGLDLDPTLFSASPTET